jgi:diacylglycerol kinase family enzyme
VHMQRARHVVLESSESMIVEVDGEIPYLEARRLEMDILPKRLRVIV